MAKKMTDGGKQLSSEPVWLWQSSLKLQQVIQYNFGVKRREARCHARAFIASSGAGGVKMPNAAGRVMWHFHSPLIS